MKRAISYILFLAFLLVGFFQNCSEIKLGSTQQNSSAVLPKAGEWDLCPKTNFYMSDSFYPTGNTNTNTSGIGPMVNGTTMVIKFTPLERPRMQIGSKTSAFFSSVYGGDAERNWSVSRTACDFTPENAVTYLDKKLAGTTWTNLTFNYNYGFPGSGAALILGETYYLNIFVVSGCQSSDCHFGPISFQ